MNHRMLYHAAMTHNKLTLLSVGFVVTILVWGALFMLPHGTPSVSAKHAQLAVEMLRSSRLSSCEHRLSYLVNHDSTAALSTALFEHYQEVKVIMPE